MAALQRLTRRPTLWVEAAVAGAWVALATGSVAAWSEGGSSGGALWSNGALWICTTGLGKASSAAHVAAGGTSTTAASLLAAAPMWALMSGAMMVPVAMPAVRHVAVHSLYWRRRRAIVEFLFAFLAVWLLFSVLALGALTGWEPAGSQAALPAVLALAALWQLTPLKDRALRACHRSSPLPPRGWRAILGSARFGLQNGGACVASCWLIMAAVALTGSPTLLWMALATAVVCAERLDLKPRTAARRVAVLLAAAGLGFALAALLG